jgi:hypothetical protein
MMRSVFLSIAVMAVLTAALADQWVNGYYRSDGTYVQGYMRSEPDNKYWNNWSSSGSTNPYTSEKGYDLPKLEDYLKKPAYYDYKYRPDGYTSRNKTQSYPLYVTPSFGSDYQLPSTPNLYESPYDNTYKSNTEDYAPPYNYEYTPSGSDDPTTEYDLDGDE